MVDNYYNQKTKKELKKQLRRETRQVKRFFSRFFTITLSLIFVFAILIGTAIITHNLYFHSFFVNGQSMYPTLNGNATYSDGTKIGPSQNRGDNGNVVEYGIMDMHERAIEKINRFDIIILIFNEFDTKDKIKRVIGMPGDTFYFVATNPNEELNGDLYIKEKGSDDFLFTPQNFGDEQLLRSRSYVGSHIPNEDSPLTLRNNEFYVLGDNRSDSNDSAAVGPILYEHIKGVAIAVEGTCTLVCSNGSCTAEQIKFSWPRFLKWKND